MRDAAPCVEAKAKAYLAGRRPDSDRLREEIGPAADPDRRRRGAAPAEAAAALGERDKEGFPTLDLYLAGDDAEEVHAKLRRALDPKPRRAPRPWPWLAADMGQQHDPQVSCCWRCARTPPGWWPPC